MVAAQNVTVTDQRHRINGSDAPGFQTELSSSREQVISAWSKFLKDIGKTRTVAEGFTVTSPAMGGTVYDKQVVYASISGDEKTGTVWLGIIPEEWKVNDIELVNKELKKLVYQFGVQFYRAQIQAQIDEAQQALDAVQRQQQRLTNQNKDYHIKLSNNEQDKIQLEKSLDMNKLEHAVLLQKIENNRLSQDSVANAGEQIKKVIEMHKERQRKIN